MHPSRALFLRLFSIGWLLTTITNFPAAFTHTSLNTAVHLVNGYLNESYSARGTSLGPAELVLFKSGMNNVWYAAQVAGALLSAIVCDRLGRKFAYIASIVMMSSASALQTLSTTLLPFPELMIVGRIIMALFSPLSDAALILYLQECAPTHLRGTLSSLFSTGYAVMCLIGMPLGHESLLGHSLPLLLFIPFPVGVLSTIFLVFMPETPKYLMITKRDREGALRSLAFFQGKKADHESTLEALTQEMRSSNDTKQGDGSLKSLLTTPHLRRAMFLSISALFLTLPFYPILQSSTHFFTTIGIERSRAQIQSTLLMVLLTLSCLVSTSLMDIIPRRKLLLTFATLAYSSLFVFSLASQFGYPNIATVSVFSFLLAYGVGIGPVSWCVSPELVPLSHRSIMFCICYASHSILVVITNFATIPLFEIIGGVCFIPIFIVPAFLILILLYFYLPETAGRETHDIIQELRCAGKIGEEKKAIG
ncbi:hypothetical protein PMAYCL1PPCAC_17721, partial [Pristionchus mayeri]